MKGSSSEFEQLLDYRFNNKDLLKQALIRKSAFYEKPYLFDDYNEKSNKRLEYLGDAVLRCVISGLLRINHPSFSEGRLSIRRDELIFTNSDSFREIAQKLKIDRFASLSESEGKVLYNSHSQIPANIIKTLIGAIFKDSNQCYFEVKRVIATLWKPLEPFDFFPVSSCGLPKETYDFESITSLSRAFKDKDLFKQALTHASLTNEKGDKNNEILEFFGDSVLRLVISDLLMEENSKYDVDKLNPERDKLVSNKEDSMLHRIADKLIISDFIRIGKGIPCVTLNILVDTVEALIGAVFMDCGEDYSCIRASIKKCKQSYQSYTESTISKIIPEGRSLRFSPGYEQQKQQRGSYCDCKSLGCYGLVCAAVIALAATTIASGHNVNKSEPKPRP